MPAMNTLVVDDSKSARFALRKFLEAGGHAVETADSGEAALDLLGSAARAGQRLPEAIFLDHIMPGLDGFETLARLRADAQLYRVPVIICSSNEGPAFVTQAQALGAAGVLQKPPSREQLEQMLRMARAWQASPFPAPPPALAAAVPGPTPGSLSAAEPPRAPSVPPLGREPASATVLPASPPAPGVPSSEPTTVYPYPDPAPVAPLPPPGAGVGERLRALRTTPLPAAPAPAPVPSYNPLPENAFTPAPVSAPSPSPVAPPPTAPAHDPLYSPGFAASLGVSMPHAAPAEPATSPTGGKSVSWNLPAPSVQLPDGAASQAEVASLRDALARLEERVRQPASAPPPPAPSAESLRPLVDALLAERMQALSQQIEAHLGQLRAGIEQVLTAQNERIETLAAAPPAPPAPDMAAIGAAIDRLLGERLAQMMAVLGGSAAGRS